MDRHAGTDVHALTGWAPERRTDEESLETWRWRSYTAHLADLGYDLDTGGPPDDRFEAAVADSRARGAGGET